MAAVRSYRDLVVWQRGMELVDACYELAGRLPPQERYGLASQLQRAAVSVPANIAEGHGRATTGDYLRHLSIANGLLMELETLILICERREHLTPEEAAEMLAGTETIAGCSTH